MQLVFTITTLQLVWNRGNHRIVKTTNLKKKLYKHPQLLGCSSLVPSPRPAFRRFAVWKATESWAGPGNEARLKGMF